VTRRWRGSLVIGFALIGAPALAHHSFAIYDMEQNIVFDGVVETLKMRNPHIAMTLTVTKGDGTQGTVNFVEGAPANMLVRRGLNPADIAVGKPIRAIGAPLHDDPNAFFLKAVILPDGRRFVFVGGE
jgi:hypothetical protein